MNKKTYGGSAVPNGVMLSDGDKYAIAVRDLDGKINTIFEEEKSYIPKQLFEIPIIRGFAMFLDMTVFSKIFKAMELSMPKEKIPKKSTKIFSYIIASIVAVILMYFLFYFLPKAVSSLLVRFIPFLNENLIISLLFVTIFISYIVSIFKFHPMGKTLRYFHGAEHKTINCYENGDEVNIKNARKCSTIHPRCGTSFIGYLVFIKLLIFNVIFNFIVAPTWVKTITLVFLFSLTYEVFKLVNKHEVILLRPVKKFGLLMQSFTTAEPSDEQLETAIVAFNMLRSEEQ